MHKASEAKSILVKTDWCSLEIPDLDYTIIDLKSFTNGWTMDGKGLQ